MSFKKPTIHILLIICIGLLPVVASYAADIGQMHPMPENCIDCDYDGASMHESCEGVNCTAASAACGSQAGASYLPASQWDQLVKFFRPSGGDSPLVKFRSHLAFSIFRPPIA